MKHSAAEIHSDRTLSQRREALEGFKAGKYRILVATDIAARGIDVTGIEVVLNYDLPEDEENYVHRIGRTGRAGKVGHAISFAMPDQKDDVDRIERLMRIALPVMTHPDVPSEKFNGLSRRRGLEVPPGYVPPKSMQEHKTSGNGSRKRLMSSFCRGGRRG